MQDFELGDPARFFTDAADVDAERIWPPKSPAAPPATAIEGGRCGVSAYGFRTTGSSLQGWGMSFGYAFEASPRDLSSWDGVAFWARRGEESGSTLFFSIVDVPHDERASGGACLYESDIPSERCDPYGTGIGLETQWRYYRIDFEQLRQRGFGKASEQLETSRVLRLAWTMGPGDWDIWLDDLALYRQLVPDSKGAQGGSAGATQ